MANQALGMPGRFRLTGYSAVGTWQALQSSASDGSTSWMKKKGFAARRDGYRLGRSRWGCSGALTGCLFQSLSGKRQGHSQQNSVYLTAYWHRCAVMSP